MVRSLKALFKKVMIEWAFSCQKRTYSGYKRALKISKCVKYKLHICQLVWQLSLHEFQYFKIYSLYTCKNILYSLLYSILSVRLNNENILGEWHRIKNIPFCIAFIGIYVFTYQASASFICTNKCLCYHLNCF